jgi:chemotaxis response regulator CheB
MPIKVLLADGSDVMRSVIAKLIHEEPSTELVGEAKGFAETIQLACALKPDVFLMELHMSDEEQYPPESVEAQLCGEAGCVLAISLWNDEKAKALAQRFGARALLDKVNLYSELIFRHKAELSARRCTLNLIFVQRSGRHSKGIKMHVTDIDDLEAVGFYDSFWAVGY